MIQTYSKTLINMIAVACCCYMLINMVIAGDSWLIYGGLDGSQIQTWHLAEAMRLLQRLRKSRPAFHGKAEPGQGTKVYSPSYEFLRCTDALAEFRAGNDTNLSKQLCIALLLALGWMICLQYMCFNYQDIELVCKKLHAPGACKVLGSFLKGS